MRAKKAWCVAGLGLPVLCESGAAQTPDLLLQTTGFGSLMTDFRSLEAVTGPGFLRFDLVHIAGIIPEPHGRQSGTQST